MTSQDEITKIHQEIFHLVSKLNTLQNEAPLTPVPHYSFRTLAGTPTLSDLFGEKKSLFAIHNMGQGCRYCTLWADGINAFLPHLETEFSVVLFSKDSPETQRRFANDRGWRFQLASHGGDNYIKEQSVVPNQDNYPGVVYYEKKSGEIYRKNSAPFGPGDMYCSLWHLLSLAGRSAEDWTPQFRYWTRPKLLDDGGENLVE
ncbi:DUF899 family protein [bacterium]|nr:DUF899 family protein [bacterium]